MNKKINNISEIRKQVYEKFLIPESKRSSNTLAEITGLNKNKFDYRKYKTWDLLLNRTYSIKEEDLATRSICSIVEKDLLPIIRMEYERSFSDIQAKWEQLGITAPNKELNLAFSEEIELDHAGREFFFIKIFEPTTEINLVNYMLGSDKEDIAKNKNRQFQGIVNNLLLCLCIEDLYFSRIPLLSDPKKECLKATNQIYCFLPFKKIQNLLYN